jgi:hypothetical protein
MAAIDSLLSLDIVSNNFQLSLFSDPLQIKCASLSFRSVKELRARAEVGMRNSAAQVSRKAAASSLLPQSNRLSSSPSQPPAFRVSYFIHP